MDVVTIILYDHKLGWAGKSDAKVSVVFWQMANHTQGKKKPYHIYHRNKGCVIITHVSVLNQCLQFWHTTHVLKFGMC